MKKREVLGLVIASSLFVANGFVCSPVFAESPVDIEIVEKVDDGEGGYKPWEDITDAMPGMTYSAIPQIKNNGTLEARVAVCISGTAEKSDGSSASLPTNSFLITIGSHWLLNADSSSDVSDPASGNCYDYDSLLQPGEMTEPVFTEVTLSGEIGNELKNSTIGLHLEATAINDDDEPTPIPEPTPEPDSGSSTNPSSPDTGNNTWVGEYASYVGITFLAAGMIAMVVTLLRKKLFHK